MLLLICNILLVLRRM